MEDKELKKEYTSQTDEPTTEDRKDAAAENTEGDAAPEAGADGSGECEQSAEAADGSEETAEDASPEAGAKKEKKGFFARKKDAKDLQIEELTDRLKRSMAEFDNFRKRTEKEKASMYEIGARDIIEKILPIADNLERGLASVAEEEKGNPLAEGMEKIYKQLAKTLDDLGVKPIEAVGKEFDPNFHNAVMHIDDDSLGENIVAQELQKGYTYRGTVVRHSMVQVAN